MVSRSRSKRKKKGALYRILVPCPATVSAIGLPLILHFPAGSQDRLLLEEEMALRSVLHFELVACATEIEIGLGREGTAASKPSSR